METTFPSSTFQRSQVRAYRFCGFGVSEVLRFRAMTGGTRQIGTYPCKSVRDRKFFSKAPTRNPYGECGTRCMEPCVCLR